MNEKDMKEKIDIIIVKFLQNQSNVSEIESLTKWINEKPENKAYFEQLETVWNSVDIKSNIDQVSPEQSWNKLSSLINKEGNKLEIDTLQKNGSFSLGLILQVAAVVLISFGLSWFAFYAYYQNELRVSEGMLEVSVEKGSKSVVKLTDGTTIWLNSETTIRYPDKFANNQRDVFIEGEAFFEVAKDKNRPFKVHTSDMDIVVLGTSFNVKSYPDEGTIETTLIEGSLRIEKEKKSGTKQCISLEPNQRVTLIKKKGRILLNEINESGDLITGKRNEKLISEQNKSELPEIKRKEQIYFDESIDPDIYISWKNNKLVFKDECFESVAVKLERWYNVKIIIKNEKLKEYKFTGTFENETVEQAITALQLTTRFEYKFDKNKITIK
ncbi:MAG: FecR family protein [Bacteroidota bacterium]